MKNSISVYNFNQNQVRTANIDNQPYFNLNDCCEALGIARGYKSAVRLSAEGVRETSLLTDGGVQKAKFINEPNLYRLIFRSNKPQAQAFADWVYNEVLPSIRKTGGYNVPDRKPTFTEALLGSRELKKENQAQKALIAEMSAELLKCRPLWRRVLKYKRMGLSTAEVCKLVGRSRSQVKAYCAAMRKYGVLSPLPQSAKQLALNFTAAETVTSIAFQGE